MTSQSDRYLYLATLRYLRDTGFSLKSANVDENVASKAVDRTSKWTRISFDHIKTKDPLYSWNQTLFPIVQGGIFPHLRKQSAESLVEFSTCGMAIGGLAVGENKSSMFDTISLMDEVLPKDQPRYLMGVGRPTDLIKAIRSGVDMFDCVLPTRNARNGQLFTSSGIINITNSEHKNSFEAVDNIYPCERCCINSGTQTTPVVSRTREKLSSMIPIGPPKGIDVRDFLLVHRF